MVDFPAELASVQASDRGALTTRIGRGALHVCTPGEVRRLRAAHEFVGHVKAAS